MQVRVGRIRHDAIQVIRDSAHIFAIDHSLSLSTTMKRLVCAPRVERLMAIPQVNAASPATTTMCSLPPRRSRPTAVPSEQGRPPA